MVDILCFALFADMKNRIVTKVFGILKDFLEKVLKQSAMTADERIRVSSRVLRTSSVSQKKTPKRLAKTSRCPKAFGFFLKTASFTKVFGILKDFFQKVLKQSARRSLAKSPQASRTKERITHEK